MCNGICFDLFLGSSGFDCTELLCNDNNTHTVNIKGNSAMYVLEYIRTHALHENTELSF